MARPSSTRLTPCHQATTGARRATLFRCTAPRKCQTGRTDRRHRAVATAPPWPPARRHSSPRCRSDPAARAAATASASNPLVTATMRTDAGSAEAERRCDGGPRSETAGVEVVPAVDRASVTGSPAPTASDQTTRAWRPRSRGPDGRSSRRRRRCRHRPRPSRSTPPAARAADTAAGRSRAGRARRRSGPGPGGRRTRGHRRPGRRVGELVAAGVDAGPEGTDHPVAPSALMAATACLHHACGQAAPSGVDGGEDPLLAAQRDRARSRRSARHSGAPGPVRHQASPHAGEDGDHPGRRRRRSPVGRRWRPR